MQMIRIHTDIFFFVFTEVQCLNETQKYLRKVVHEIGLELRSTAACKGVRRTRDGPFTLQDALTHHHWTASDVIQAIRQYHSKKKSKIFPRTDQGHSIATTRREYNVNKTSDEAVVGRIKLN